MTPAYRPVSLLDADTFYFLNKTGSLSLLGWVDTDESVSPGKLWRYNQHYFDDLNALGSASRNHLHLALLERWVTENHPGFGVGWDPYPTSLRIVNWVKWSFAGNLLPATCVQSLAVQARFLVKRIEWHILGNHLFANAKALVFAGLFFSGDEARQWLTKGLKIISVQLPEQVLLDGGNFERSPMYHSIFLEDLLDLLNLARAFPGSISNLTVTYWTEVAQSMMYWLDAMRHPDGEIAFFNDAVVGIAPSPTQLKAYATRLGLQNDSTHTRVTHLVESGYIRLSSRDAVAFLDVAPVGPDYLPGHAHADTLSFELSLFGQRIFVNRGVSEYGSTEARHFERSTASHNSVAVNGENSSEVWDSFRVARRAYPLDLEVVEASDSVLVSCAHNGYRRLPGQPIHRRKWEFSDCSLIISDEIDGDFEDAIAYFHLHPSVRSYAKLDGYLLQLPNGQSISLKVESRDSKWSSSYYAPAFGKRLQTQCLEVVLAPSGARVSINWNSHD